MEKKNLFAKHTPSHWDMLSAEDKQRYLELTEAINPLTFRTSKDRLTLKFNIILNMIYDFVMYRDEDQWKRSLICGVAWLNDALAICTAQFSKLINRCKSSVNIGFQSMGYHNTQATVELASELMKVFPFMMKNSNEMRQWTFRKKKFDHEDQSIICDNGQPKNHELINSRVQESNECETSLFSFFDQYETDFENLLFSDDDLIVFNEGSFSF